MKIGKLLLYSLHITEFKHCDFQMNVAAFCLIRSLKTELEPHYNTLPECYMNLIILGRGTNSPDHPNIGLRQDNRPRSEMLFILRQ